MKQQLNLIPIGVLGRPHGVQGEINAKLTIELEEIFENNNLEHLFLFFDIDALPVPFLIDGWRTKGEDAYLLRFQGVNTKEEAERYTNLSISIEAGLLSQDTEFTPAHFIGFSLLDAQERVVGEIVNYDDSTINLLFLVQRPDGMEVMIPVADDLLQYVDVDKRVISIDIPEGLIE